MAEREAGRDGPEGTPTLEEGQDGSYICQRCGKVRPANWVCACGGEGGGGPIVPEGWDPELTAPSRPRLPLTQRPQPPR